MHKQLLQSHIWAMLPYLVFSLGVVIYGRNYFHEWDLQMGFRNGIFQWATLSAISGSSY